jgi:ubiquinol-cytochrome c reductase cytochrome c1 subunit
MMRATFPAACLLALILWTLPSFAAGEQLTPHGPADGWPHAGILGTFDRSALQRGYQVYKEVCATCHSMKLLSYRNLTEIGFSEEQVKAIASAYQVPAEPDDQGEVKPRNALPSDRFHAPFANEKAARAANNGAYPPDMSLIVKARHHGEDYIYSLLTGYSNPPEGVTVMAGMHYNPYFAGGQIAMAAPLSDGQVTYADGTQATVSQMAKDVTTFLTWAAEPKMEIRKRTGIKVILFLIVFAGLMYAAKRRVWAKLKH